MGLCPTCANIRYNETLKFSEYIDNLLQSIEEDLDFAKTNQAAYFSLSRTLSHTSRDFQEAADFLAKNGGHQECVSAVLALKRGLDHQITLLSR